MSKTPVQPLVKSQLSSSLRERLKKCGRYHASPEPVARQPKNSVTTSKIEKEQSDSKLETAFFSPPSKRQCTDVRSSTVHCENEEMTGRHSNKSPLPDQPSSLKEGQAMKGHEENSSLNQTPLSKRSRSCVSQVRGSKLDFEDTSTENTFKGQNTVDTHDTEISRGIISEKSNASDLAQSDLDRSAVTSKSDLDPSTVSSRSDLDPSAVSSKSDLDPSAVSSRSDLDPSAVSSSSGLLKVLEVKEEQLRKLRMVKMYRSKNNLEELQTLIDKWRAVSQQAVQDLHTAVPEPRPSLTELINHLGIDHQLLHFSEEDDETFF